MARHHRKWLLLPFGVAAFLLQHALQGWCPPVDIFRRLGIRTTREINDERVALKVLRGDFDEIDVSEVEPSDAKAEMALQVVADARSHQEPLMHGRRRLPSRSSKSDTTGEHMPPTILATLGVPVAAAQDSNSLAENATQAVWSTIVSIWQDFFRHLPLLIAALIVLVLTWIVAALFREFASRLLHRFRLRGSQRTLISRLVDIVIWVTGLLIAAMVVFPGLTPSNALAGLGIGSIAVGFAFKDIFENFFAGLLILWRFPFETGDFIHCQDVEGKVIEVTIRNTCIRRVSGELVVVPNSTIFKNSVDVLTYERLRRAMVIAAWPTVRTSIRLVTSSARPWKPAKR